MDVEYHFEEYLELDIAGLVGPWFLVEGSNELGCRIFRNTTTVPSPETHILVELKESWL